MVLRLTERDLSRQIVNAANECGWLVYHTFLSKWSKPGFPDLVMTREDRLIFAELKGAKGKVAPAQVEWLDTLALVPGIEVYLWREEHLQEIYENLVQYKPNCGGAWEGHDALFTRVRLEEYNPNRGMCDMPSEGL